MEEFSINSVTLHRRADRWYEVFVLIYCLVSTECVAVHYGNMEISTLVSFFQRKLFQKSSGLLSCNFTNLSPATILF